MLRKRTIWEVRLCEISYEFMYGDQQKEAAESYLPAWSGGCCLNITVVSNTGKNLSTSLPTKNPYDTASSVSCGSLYPTLPSLLLRPQSTPAYDTHPFRMTDYGGEKRKRWWAKVKDELTPRRDLLLLKLVLTLHIIGFSFLPFMTPYARQLGITYNEMAIIFALEPISAILGPLIAGMLADKTGRYKLVVVVTIIMSAVFTILLLYIPATPLPTLTLTCHTAGHSLIWDSCDICQDQRNNTFLHLHLQNCEAKCVPPPAEFEMCFTGDYNNSCITLYPDAQVTLNGTVVTTVKKNICSYTWTEVRHEGQVYSGLKCPDPNPDPCPVRCQVSSPPHCTHPDDPSNSPLTFWMYFLHRQFWKTFTMSGYTIMTAITIAILKERGGEYGKQRVIPLIASSITPVVIGALVDWYSEGQDQSDYTLAVYITALFYLITAALVTRLDFMVEKPQHNMLVDLRCLVTSIEVDAFLFVVFCLGANWGFQESFIYVYLRSLDAPYYILGLASFTSKVSAVPVVFLADKILNKCGYHSVFIFSFFLYFLNNFACSYIRAPWMVVALLVTKPLGFNLPYMGMIKLCPRLAPKGLLATMNGLMNPTLFTFGFAAGSSLGGVLVGSLGMTGAFRTFAYTSLGLGICYIALYILYIRRRYGRDDCVQGTKESTETGTTEEGRILEEIMLKEEEQNGNVEEQKVEKDEVRKIDKVCPMLTARPTPEAGPPEDEIDVTLKPIKRLRYRMTWQLKMVELGSSLVTYSVLTLLTVMLANWFYKRRQKVLLIEQIPGPKALPILGNALEVNVEPRDLFQVISGGSYIWSQITPLMRVWAGPFPLIQLFKCSVVEVILSSNKHLDKSRDYTFLHPWLGTGLLTSTGSKWHSRRKMLTPAFHFKILEDFLEVFNSQSTKMVEKLAKKADGQRFDIFPYITLCTLDVICETAMGVNIKAQDNSDSDYVKAVYRIGALVQQRQARPWLQSDLLYRLIGSSKEHDACLKILHGFSYGTIRSRRIEFQKEKTNKLAKHMDDEIIGKKRRLAFLDLLLEYSEEGRGLSDEDIREEVDTFMFEGHDTTAAAINWSLYLLGCHPEIQARVHEELDMIFSSPDQPVTMAELREMKLTENCIKEALRLFPSVPFLARELQEEAVIDNYRIPEGTTVMVVTYRLHRDPDQFPDPERFDPDRFLPENVSKRHPYAYVPFSAGPRNCIGQKFALMEEKILLSSILRKYRAESCTRREDLRLLGELILRPENGNTVKLFPRV
ncbi:hypothetical protein Pmani_000074 [Petrolisthes manimaculis]|uniref:Major facilitator superfamily associated domain-containing protein n=1 Tax=Petrolisthes manimaculis TaxID=1843537 RepID=A0AAE1UTD5_9EUCA|nr:hypothetical protein Pmani_000074 [Petrolisthes manimaculis]